MVIILFDNNLFPPSAIKIRNFVSMVKNQNYLLSSGGKQLTKDDKGVKKKAYE